MKNTFDAGSQSSHNRLTIKENNNRIKRRRPRYVLWALIQVCLCFWIHRGTVRSVNAHARRTCVCVDTHTRRTCFRRGGDGGVG